MHKAAIRQVVAGQGVRPERSSGTTLLWLWTSRVQIPSLTLADDLVLQGLGYPGCLIPERPFLTPESKGLPFNRHKNGKVRSMGRKANWPPEPHPHRASGQDRCRYLGVDYYLGPIGSAESRKSYVELIKRLESEGKAPVPTVGPAGQPPILTVAQVVIYWHIHATEACSAAEVENYRYALGPLTSLHGSLPASQFKGPQLRAVQGEMIKLGWSRPYINHCISRIRTVWRWAEGEGHAPEGSWAALSAVVSLSRARPGLKEGRKVAPVDWERVERTAAVCPPGLRRLILLGWWTGARPSELCKLRVRDLEMNGDVWFARLEKHKNAWRGHERALTFGPQSRELLEIRLAESRDPNDLICPNTKGRAYNRNSLGLAIRRACKRAGVANYHAYALRHAYRVRVTREASMDAARVLLGHRSVETTARYGVGADHELAQQAARKVG